MTAAAVTPAAMPGAAPVLCRKAKPGWRCIRKAGHGGNCTLVAHALTQPDGTPRNVLAELAQQAPTPPAEVAVPRPPRASPHATADALEAAAKMLRWSTHRALTAEERSLLRTVHASIVKRVHTDLGSGGTSPPPDPQT